MIFLRKNVRAFAPIPAGRLFAARAGECDRN
jgi:hypothetical protein